MRAVVLIHILFFVSSTFAAKIFKITELSNYGSNVIEISKKKTELICNSSVIKNYPMLQGLPKNEPWTTLTRVKKFNENSLACPEKVLIERTVDNKTIFYQDCRDARGLRNWLNEISRRCGR